MPSLSFFIDEQDIGRILNRLNADPEIAFIVPDGLPEDRGSPTTAGFAFTLTDGELKEVSGWIAELVARTCGASSFIQVNTDPRKPQNAKKIIEIYRHSPGFELPSPDHKTPCA